MELPHYIPDGYTRKGYIKAEKGYHPELRFWYRPCKAAVRQLHCNRNHKATSLQPDGRHGDAEATVKVAVDAIVQGLVSLELRDHEGRTVTVAKDGQLVPTARKLIASLEPNLLFKLRDEVLGIRDPRDEDPLDEKPAQAADEDVAEMERRLEAGEEPDDLSAADRELLREAKDEGN